MRRSRLLTVALGAVVALAACSDEGTGGSEQSVTTEAFAPDDPGAPAGGETGETGEPDESHSDGTAAPPTSEPDVEPWRRTALHVDFGDETVAEIECPREGHEYAVWGTGVYTDDSSICTAAVHAGLITFDDGGSVEIEKLPGRDSYEGSSANGVSTDSYGAWGGSFRVIE